MTFQQILDRDVPAIRAYVQRQAMCGICGPVQLYYKHEAITAEMSHSTRDMQSEGWTKADAVIPASIPYSAYFSFISNRAGSWPLFA